MGTRATQSTLDLARLIDCGPTDGARRVGIEQEFTIRGASGVVDFRNVVRARPLPGCHLDRADPNAHRLSWGGVITADGAEAEVATPTARLDPGFTTVLTSWLAHARSDLDDFLGDELQASGYSTHINVEVSDRRALVIGRRLVDRHAGALMLLMDRETSPGLLVRPRRARLELGGEFVAGRQLSAASVFSAAAVHDCEARRHSRPLRIPRAVAATGRFGWYIDRCAFGDDLYRRGRSARVGRHTGQDLLAWSWESIRSHAEAFSTERELAIVDDIVCGVQPLPCEQPIDDHGDWRVRDDSVDLTHPQCRGRWTLTPVLATWDLACFALHDANAHVIVAVASSATARLLHEFVRGGLDVWCETVLAARPDSFTVLSDPSQVGTAGVFSSIEPGATMMPNERHPTTGSPGGVNTPPGERHQKHHDEGPRRHVPGRLIAAGVVGAAVLIGGIAVLATRGDDDKKIVAAPETTAAPVATQPAATPIVTEPVLETVSTEAPTTTVAAVVPACDASAIAGGIETQQTGEGGFGPAADASKLDPGGGVRTAADGYAEVSAVEGSTTRLDSVTEVVCVGAARLDQKSGRTWSRTGENSLVVITPAGEVDIGPQAAVLVDCRIAPTCVVVVLAGHADAPLADGSSIGVEGPHSVSLLAQPGDPAQAAAIAQQEQGSVIAVPYDAVFSDPWVADNAARDAAAGRPDGSTMYASLGPTFASMTGTFRGQRTVTVAECTAGPCDVGAAVGDVADRTYEFSIDCTSGFPCVGTVLAQYSLGDTTTEASIPLTFDGATYSWTITGTSEQCTFDNDGDGTYESKLGTLDLTISYSLTPTAAEVRDGMYVVTAFHAIADAVNDVVGPDPRCTGFGSSHNSGDIVATR